MTVSEQAVLLWMCHFLVSDPTETGEISCDFIMYYYLLIQR